MRDDERSDKATLEMSPGRDLGPYRLVRRIGEGGMGAVWEARHRDTDARVAVKVLRDDRADDAETRERLLREGHAAARVRHPHAVELLDVGSDGGVAYLAFEYLEGETLAARLAREGSLPHAALCGVMLPVLAAVSAAHRAGVVHRDLKPANLFLVQVDGVVLPKVLDFGISKLPAHSDLDTLTETGTTLGTPAYMSPEQLRSARDATVRSDIFSLGVVSYECATGRRPFAGETAVALFESILADRYTSAKQHAPALPARFDAALRRALRPHPEERFALVDAFARELLADAPAAMRARWAGSFAAEGEVADAGPSPREGSTRPALAAVTLARRRPRAATALAVTALAVVPFGAWSLRTVTATVTPRSTPAMSAPVVAAPPVAAPLVAAPLVAAPPVVPPSTPAVVRRPRRPAAVAAPVAAVAAEDAGARHARLPVGTNLMPF